ncbi:hypothetical protein UA08_01831 [Talaromyces atroroseus]|uniref:Carrier domain-containing protein n=1 Tax=Talaromyces atroroseus TaxID=1441469 RepID=A0A1Q5QC77_TALAT|nr:hypothetical protein UA08_01831 [Talaromyces atroroseus]OKL63557.1 hypothetical protein UA08_01831 [Talaromyces atroroseus]
MNSLLAEIASQYPSSLAIEDGSRSLTYNDLLQKADALGRAIQEHPLEPEEAIAVIHGLSIEMVIAQVALLRLNLTSVPLDPGLPKLRIREMLDDIKVRYAIASTGFEDLGFSIISMPIESRAISLEDSSPGLVSLREPTRSHILYTSGSTGKSKAVQITPTSLVCLAQSTMVTPLQRTDRVALINNSGFDISLFEVWATLLDGARMVVVPREIVIDPFAFRGFIVEKRLTVVLLTTSLFNATGFACPTAFKDVREVLTGGEVASPLAMRTVLESGGPPTLDLKALESAYWGYYKGVQNEDGNETQDSAFVAMVRDLWSSLLGIPIIKEEDDFFELGGSSIKSAMLISRLRMTTGKSVSMRALHQNSRFVEFVAYLNEFAEGAVARHQSERWREDSHMADGLSIILGETPEWTSKDEGRVFMTGATGFVGVNFLARLLRHPRVKEAVCLVRAKSKMRPRTRVEEALKKYNLWDDTASSFSKLTALDGDISKDRLGLSQDKFTWLSQLASVIFHLGAKVNFCEPYEAHFEPNVLGTKNVLELALSGRRKAFHFTSSIDAWGPNGLILGTRKCLEDETLEPNLKGLPYDIGYAASKWCSEQMVRTARDRGLPTAIYRPGFVTGDSKTGAGNPDDFFARLMVGLVAPDPADSVNLEKTISVINDAGYPVESIPYWDWVNRLHDPKNSDNPLMPLMPLIQEKVWADLTRFQTSQDTPHYDSTNTVAALADAPDIGYIAFSSEQLNRFLRFWRYKSFYHV